MAKRKPEPVITQEAILSIAGRSIQAEIIKLRKEEEELLWLLEDTHRADEIPRVREMTERQVSYHMERLKAIETMYKIQTGGDLGLTDELT